MPVVRPDKVTTPSSSLDAAVAGRDLSTSSAEIIIRANGRPSDAATIFVLIEPIDTLGSGFAPVTQALLTAFFGFWPARADRKPAEKTKAQIKIMERSSNAVSSPRLRRGF